ncbi:MAG: PD-(D/E)XK nuclease family transposase [Oribacterium sp.]|nr:PD-(D/E)XK nuclease family transposase [Oribacterium sp.]
MTVEEKIAKVRDLRPIDDVFFEVLAEDKEVCEEILRTILEDDGLVVNEAVVQGSKKNIYGRSVRLDALCTLGDGSKCNIEVQRADNDDHLRRARFNAASITVKDSDPGERFENILDLYIVYISEFDFLKGGLTIYHVDKTIRENGQVVDDGLHEIFVNTSIDDGSDIADLMSCFEKKEVNNKKFPKFSQRVADLKTTEGGATAVCDVMKHYEDIARNEGANAMLYSLVSDGSIDVTTAAAKAGVDESVFISLMEKDGFALPVIVS